MVLFLAAEDFSSLVSLLIGLLPAFHTHFEYSYVVMYLLLVTSLLLALLSFNKKNIKKTPGTGFVSSPA